MSEQVAGVVVTPERVTPAPLRVEVLRDVEAAAACWSACETTHVTTPYQRLAFCRAHARTLGALDKTDPLVLIASGSSGRPVLLLPLEVRSVGPVRIARPLGGKHVNFSVPVFDPLLCHDIGRAEMALILDQAGRAADIDVFFLPHVPLVWNGHANPIAKLPGQESANVAYRDALGAEVDTTLQTLRGTQGLRKLRSKWRKLEEAGSVAHLVASSVEDRMRVLNAFATQKAAWFAARGIPNPFGSDAGRAFLSALAADPSSGFEWHALTVGEDIVATFGGAHHQGRYTTSINSYTAGDLARWSPGDILLRELIAHAVRAGCHTFDLGVGAAEYKRHWLSQSEPMVDVAWGVGALGTLTAGTLALALRAKRAWKNRRRTEAA